MKYIVYQTKDNKVLHILDEEPISLSKGLSVARCENLPTLNKSNGEYLEVSDVQEKSETYKKREPKEVKKVDEEGNAYTKTEYVEVEKERTYYTCELTIKQSEKTVKRIRLRKLKNWFDNEYRYYSEKLTRFKALDISEVITDKVFNVEYTNLDELYTQAEKIRAEINDLENKGGN